jgi:hypothetical protein
MAAIYDKALKRRDFSGVIDQDKAKEAAEKKAAVAAGTPPVLSKAEKKAKDKADKKKAEKADDPKAGAADTGKIVNLMAGDANRIAMQLSGEFKNCSRSSAFSSVVPRTVLFVRRPYGDYYRLYFPVSIARILCLRWIRCAFPRMAFE